MGKIVYVYSTTDNFFKFTDSISMIQLISAMLEHFPCLLVQFKDSPCTAVRLFVQAVIVLVKAHFES